MFPLFFTAAYLQYGDFIKYLRLSYVFIVVIIICGCDTAIWMKFKHGSVASQQQNREAQNLRLTRTAGSL